MVPKLKYLITVFLVTTVKVFYSLTPPAAILRKMKFFRITRPILHLGVAIRLIPSFWTICFINPDLKVFSRSKPDSAGSNTMKSTTMAMVLFYSTVVSKFQTTKFTKINAVASFVLDLVSPKLKTTEYLATIKQVSPSATTAKLKATTTNFIPISTKFLWKAVRKRRKREFWGRIRLRALVNGIMLHVAFFEKEWRLYLLANDSMDESFIYND